MPANAPSSTHGSNSHKKKKSSTAPNNDSNAAAAAAGAAAEAPDDDAQLLYLLQSGSTTAFRELLIARGKDRVRSYLNRVYDPSVDAAASPFPCSGDLLFYAGYLNNRPLMKEIITQLGSASTSAAGPTASPKAGGRGEEEETQPAQKTDNKDAAVLAVEKNAPALLKYDKGHALLYLISLAPQSVFLTLPSPSSDDDATSPDANAKGSTTNSPNREKKTKKEDEGEDEESAEDSNSQSRVTPGPNTILHVLCRRPKPSPVLVKEFLTILRAQYRLRLAREGEGGDHGDDGSASIRESSPRAPSPSPSQQDHHHHHHHASFQNTATRSNASTVVVMSKDVAEAVAEFLNRRDPIGFTCLHVVATYGSGLEARDVAKLLLKYGADDTLLAPNGQSAAYMCKNGYVRHALAAGAFGRPRAAPQASESYRQKIDRCATSESFPPLPVTPKEDALAPPAMNQSTDGAAADGGAEEEDDGKRKKGAPLSQEEVDALVSRLYEESIRKKEMWAKEKQDQLQAEDDKRYHGKQLSAEEVEESVGRLYQQSVDHATEVSTMLEGKYLAPREGPPPLGGDDLEACLDRLYKGSIERSASSMKALQDKYAAPAERKKLSKAEMEASAQRLWKESMETAAKNWGSLFDEYCKKEEGRKLTKEEVEAMAKRLSSKS